MSYEKDDILTEYFNQTRCKMESLGQMGRFGPEEKMRVFTPEPLRPVDVDLPLIPKESLLWKIKVD